MSKRAAIVLRPRKLEEIIRNWSNGERVRHGTFICRERCNLYIGADNRTGEMFVEEFSSKQACLKWLEEKIDE